MNFQVVLVDHNTEHTLYYHFQEKKHRVTEHDHKVSEVHNSRHLSTQSSVSSSVL